MGDTLFYKIRRKGDGKFSTGGTTPGFSKKGKIWKQWNHLTSHLGYLFKGGLRAGYSEHVKAGGPFTYDGQTQFTEHVYENCEVVTYEAVEVSTEYAMDVLDGVKKKREKKEVDRQNRMDEWRKEQRRIAYEKLKNEFEK